MSDPLITIIMATYNSEKYLQQAIDSVKVQSYKNLELIIIDGGSVDKTVEIIKQNQSAITYWLSEKDTGISDAWNKGLKIAKGDWISFLGSDDYLWGTNVVEFAANYIKSLDKEYKIVYSQIMFLNKNGSEPLLFGKPWDEVKGNFPEKNVLPHPSVLHHKSLFAEFGLFDETFRILGDYEFLLRFLGKVKIVQIPNLIYVAMRDGGISNNPKFAIKKLKEAHRAKTKNNIPTNNSYYYLLFATYTKPIFVKILGGKLSKKIFRSKYTIVK